MKSARWNERRQIEKKRRYNLCKFPTQRLKEKVRIRVSERERYDNLAHPLSEKIMYVLIIAYNILKLDFILLVRYHNYLDITN